jgi:pimeloyl-ACP methyl ester carboxylesterase
MPMTAVRPKRRAPGRRWARRTAIGLAILVGVVAVASNVPEVRARTKGLAVLARGAGYPFPRPFANRVTVSRVELAPGVEGDLYDPGVTAPPLMLVPGGAPKGAEDPAMIQLARSFAGAHRLVFVPELELRHQTFAWSDIEALRRAVLVLSERPGSRGRVGLLGLSYGGSFGLLAAEDPAVEARLAFVGVFGSYVDLLHVIQGITTGATTFHGRVVPWTASPDARRILEDAAISLTPATERGALEHALATHDGSGLPPDAAGVFAILEDTDPRRTAELVRALPADMRDTIERFSPSAHLAELKVPLFILQSEDDLATPPTEARSLHEAVPESRLAMVEHFEHVRPGGAGAPIAGRIADAWRAWSFVTWVLRAQE